MILAFLSPLLSTLLSFLQRKWLSVLPYAAIAALGITVLFCRTSIHGLQARLQACNATAALQVQAYRTVAAQTILAQTKAKQAQEATQASITEQSNEEYLRAVAHLAPSVGITPDGVPSGIVRQSLASPPANPGGSRGEGDLPQQLPTAAQGTDGPDQHGPALDQVCAENTLRLVLAQQWATKQSQASSASQESPTDEQRP